MFYCLVNLGDLVLTSAMSERLYRTAQKMAQSRKSSMKFRGRDCQGKVSTEWDTGAMGTISGIQFIGEIEKDGKSGKVTFIVRSFDLATDHPGAWSTFETPQELHEAILQDALEERQRSRSRPN